MILRIENLSKRFGRRGFFGAPRGEADPGAHQAVDEVSLQIAEGETLGLVGESGCGKTTLARCVLRLLEPDSGRIFFQGIDWLALSGPELRRRRRHLQAIFQDPYASLNPMMTVEKILAEPFDVHGGVPRRERPARAAALLREVGLDASALSRRPDEFSGGQRQRIAIARALCLEPELIVADEPVSALDVSVQGQILDLLARLKARRRLALLFISHSLPVVRMICDRIAVMRRGKLVELAPPSLLFSRPRHAYTRVLLECAPDLDPARRPPPPELPEHFAPGELREVEPGHWVAE